MKFMSIKHKYLFIRFSFVLASLVVFAAQPLHAQSARSLINDGVDHYDKKKFSESEVNFKKGLEKLPENFNGYFNLGDAQYKQERYDEAVKSYQQSLTKTTDNQLKSKAFHNIGNSLMKSQKYKESVDAYKNALKLNPKDEDTKYNLSYALNLLRQQQNQQKNDKNNQQDKQNKDQQKDQKNQDKNKDNKDNKDQQNKDQNKQDQNKDQNKQDQNKDQQNQQNQNQQDRQDNTAQKQEKPKMSKDEAERILNAIKNNEQDLQKKLQKREGKAIKTDKDW